MIVTHSTCLGVAAFQQGLDVVWIDVEMFAEGLDGPGHLVVRVRHGGPGSIKAASVALRPNEFMAWVLRMESKDRP